PSTSAARKSSDAATSAREAQPSLRRRGCRDPGRRARGVELSPLQTYRLMDAPWGLLGQVAAPVGINLPSPANGFLDAAVAMAFVDPELSGVRPPNSLTWSGTLLAPTTGDYRMAFAAEDPMQLEVDSQRVAVVTVPPDGFGPRRRGLTGTTQCRP